MAGGKLSARQKMINMMYLVLTALLALNVSKEILKAFHLMEVSFNKANANVDKKNTNLLAALKEQSQNRPEEVGPYYERAKIVKKESGIFVKYIEELKKTLIDRADGRKEPEAGENPGETELESADNIELHANYFFKNPADEKAKELTEMVNNTREKLLALMKDGNGVVIDKKDRDKIANLTNLKTLYDENKYPSWAEMYFEHAPLAGVITMLTKIQNDCRNTEADIIEVLARNIDKKKISFDRLEAKVIANSTAVMVGSEYKAEVLLVASNSKSENPVMVNGVALPMENGKGIYTVRPSTQGTFTWKGVIQVKGDQGVQDYPFESEYQAFQGAATISADAMNVLYIGLDNPISISVAGYTPSDILPTMSGGSLVRSGKGYIAKVTKRGKAIISASVKMKDGSTRKMGEQEYRIKDVPKPEALFGTLESGSYPAAALLGQRAITAVLPNFVFEGVKFTVREYACAYVPRRGNAQFFRGSGAVISNELKGAIQSAKGGDKVLVDDISAIGPGGVVKRLSPIVITIR
ncbi:MAG: gliding motility protein GldM [Flavobacteriales bacterium]|nr:gliding motility protein GldM [Flavobacteriales bacterium]